VGLGGNIVDFHIATTRDITLSGDRTKAQTTKALTTIPHKQNRTVIEAHATKARIVVCAFVMEPLYIFSISFSATDFPAISPIILPSVLHLLYVKTLGLFFPLVYLLGLPSSISFTLKLLDSFFLLVYLLFTFLPPFFHIPFICPSYCHYSRSSFAISFMLKQFL
jgi:hypothetical protein